MFPTEKFQPVENIEWRYDGEVIHGTNVDLLQSLLGYVFDEIPALADFEVERWEAYDDWGRTARIKLSTALDNGDILETRFGYSDSDYDESYFWGTLLDQDGNAIDKLEWGTIEQLAEWLSGIIAQSQQMRMF